MLIICCATPNELPSALSPASGVPTFTAITMSAPSARAKSTGRLRTKPPSTSKRPLTRTGANTPGTESEARIVMNNETSDNSTNSPVNKSDATERNGNASRLAGRSCVPGGSKRISACSSAPLPAVAGGNVRPCRSTPNSIRVGNAMSSSRRRNVS